MFYPCIILVFILHLIRAADVSNDDAQKVLDKYLNSLTTKTGFSAALSSDFSLIQCNGKEIKREKFIEEIRISKIILSERSPIENIVGSSEEYSFKSNSIGIAKTMFTVKNDLIQREIQTDCNSWNPILTASIDVEKVAGEYCLKVLKDYFNALKTKAGVVIWKIAAMNFIDDDFKRYHCNGTIGTKNDTYEVIRNGEPKLTETLKDPVIINAKFIENGEKIECTAKFSADNWVSENKLIFKVLRNADDKSAVLLEEVEETCENSPFNNNKFKFKPKRTPY
ncbi:unnamed protein product [Caenorhabditis angaria]|uniref:Uncharacterized protein n=1 Tax=Caenorhabditis angaria TaxID=860376 RepID=A0A9P1IT70_9PELO|nr:unnamed protein product [Caenorhabditis angaria]